MKKSQVNIIAALIKEADAYTSIEIIENSIELGGDLSQFPIQPLYLTLRTIASESLAALLPRLGKEQRKTFLDIDLWSKDNVDVNEFERWITPYYMCQDEEVKLEFVQSDQFLFYLKSRFNIWTFDAEDPLYPDHDYYFLTDDTLLLFEYDESMGQVDQTRALIRELYAELGVENAYSLLFKFVEESFLILQEEFYQSKKGRLQDYGMVDYFDALEVISLFPSVSHIDHFIKAREKLNPNSDTRLNQQALHKNSLVGFDSFSNSIDEELAKIKDVSRLESLRWSFIRLVNSSISYEQALKEGTFSMARVGISSRAYMILGLNYTLEKYKKKKSIFEEFDFVDIYRVGKSLVHLGRRAINREFLKYDIDRDLFIKFCGSKIQSILNFDSENKNWGSLDAFKLWQSEIQFIKEFLPFAVQFYKEFNQLKSKNLLNDHFYFNYNVEEIDVEAILLSLLASGALGLLNDKKDQFKLGLKLKDAKRFLKLYETNKASKECSKFLKKYGMKDISNIDNFLQSLLEEHLEGYLCSDLTDHDFSHIGGPIILNIS